MKSNALRQMPMFVDAIRIIGTYSPMMDDTCRRVPTCHR
jgi:hypothetical protein